MKSLCKSLWILLVLQMAILAHAEDPTITLLFQNSYQAIKQMRQANGVYIDALSFGVEDKPAAISANGVGLISLCIADSMYKKTRDSLSWEPHADSLIKITLAQFITFKESGAVNAKGLFRRYFDSQNGLEFSTWGTQYSTIDNALFATALIFCRNYYSNDSAIVVNANYLLNSMDFTSAISDDGQQMYMILDDDGNRSAPTGAFNEYIIVAWLAKNTSALNQGLAHSESYWNSFYASPIGNANPQQNYWGYSLLSDNNARFISHFIPQFAYYYCHYFKNNLNYMDFFVNARKSDSLWWALAHPNKASYEWGLGAGENPGGGYSANAIDDNASAIVSPHIISGFIPVNAQGINDLKNIYDENPEAIYKLPDDTSKTVLWRYSLLSPLLRCPYIQAVDFSLMLYGLSTLPEHLGSDFFNSYNEVKTPIMAGIPVAGAPSLQAPSNNAINQPLEPVLTWNAVTSAASYRIQVAIDSSFSAIIEDDSLVYSPTKKLPALLLGTTYYWHVNTKNSSGTSSWSETRCFSTIPPIPTQVTMLLPENLAELATDRVVFVWQKPLGIVDEYLLELCSDSLMDNIIYADSQIVDTTIIYAGLQNEAKYWWRVKAHNQTGWGTFASNMAFSVRIQSTMANPIMSSAILHGGVVNREHLAYTLTKPSFVKITLYNSNGNVLTTLISQEQSTGSYQIPINTERLPKGVYLLEFQAGNDRFKTVVPIIE